MRGNINDTRHNLFSPYNVLFVFRFRRQEVKQTHSPGGFLNVFCHDFTVNKCALKGQGLFRHAPRRCAPAKDTGPDIREVLARPLPFNYSTYYSTCQLRLICPRADCLLASTRSLSPTIWQPYICLINLFYEHTSQVFVVWQDFLDLSQHCFLYRVQLNAMGLHRTSWRPLAASWRPFSIHLRQKAEALMPCRVFRRESSALISALPFG